MRLIHLPSSVWADGNVAEVAEEVGKILEQPNSDSPPDGLVECRFGDFFFVSCQDWRYLT